MTWIRRRRTRRFWESSTNFITSSTGVLPVNHARIARATLPLTTSTSFAAQYPRTATRHSPAHGELAALSCLVAEIRIIQGKQDRARHRRGNYFERQAFHERNGRWLAQKPVHPH